MSMQPCNKTGLAGPDVTRNYMQFYYALNGAVKNKAYTEQYWNGHGRAITPEGLQRFGTQWNRENPDLSIDLTLLPELGEAIAGSSNQGYIDETAAGKKFIIYGEDIPAWTNGKIEKECDLATNAGTSQNATGANPSQSGFNAPTGQGQPFQPPTPQTQLPQAPIVIINRGSGKQTIQIQNNGGNGGPQLVIGDNNGNESHTTTTTTSSGSFVLPGSSSRSSGTHHTKPPSHKPSSSPSPADSTKPCKPCDK